MRIAPQKAPQAIPFPAPQSSPTPGPRLLILARILVFKKSSREARQARKAALDRRQDRIRMIAIRRTSHLTARYVQHNVQGVNAITYTEARAELASTIKRVCRDRTPVIITRKREDAVVMMSLADYESLTETAYLLRNPRNAKRLLDSIKQLDSGKGKERALLT